MLFDIAGICRRTTLSKSTIYRLIKDGKFPAPIKIAKKRVAWREEDILAFLAGGV